MIFEDFKGNAKPLDEYDIPVLAARINVSEDALRAFVEVEAAGRPFDRQGRPSMLFEPHLFYRNLSGAQRTTAVKQGLAYKSWGEQKYPSDSYPRLKAAMKINSRAALMSASWGASQILGSNFGVAGYRSPEEMVQAFMDDAEAHIEGMVNFIVGNGIDDDIRAGRWDTVARVYNGPQYAKHGYHTRLAAAARKWNAIPDTGLPDGHERPEKPSPTFVVTTRMVRNVQQMLHDLGYHEVGTIDGRWGSRTRGAVLAFQADAGLPLSGAIDERLIAELSSADPRTVAPERANATAADLRAEGSSTIKTTDMAMTVGGTSAAATGLVAVSNQIDELTDQIGSVDRFVEAARPLTDALQANSMWIIAGLAVYLVWQAVSVRRSRLDAHRSGRHVGR